MTLAAFNLRCQAAQLVLGSALWVLAGGVLAQSVAPVPLNKANATRAVKAEAPAKVIAPSGPEWSSLSPVQKEALAPLTSSWSSINEAQKRKWLALSGNYAAMPSSERAILHGRMREWAALSTTQRSQARLNFGETRKLATEEKKAKWEAYQALSPEERRKLAAAGAKQPTGAAPAVKPVAPQKLAQAPAKASQNDKPHNGQAEQLNRNTLLPSATQGPARTPVSRP